MRIACLADLHVDVAPANREILPCLARQVQKLEPDALIICGDVSPSLADIEEALGHFSLLPCHKFFVAGNHDLWLLPGTVPDSFQKYCELIPALCERRNFTCLYKEGSMIGDIGVAGAMGWFDFSFRNRRLDEVITLDHYVRGRYRNLQWNDIRRTRWDSLPGGDAWEHDGQNFIDSHYLSRWMTDSLEEQVRKLTLEGAQQILVATHFYPSGATMRYTDTPQEDFVCAFLGSTMLEPLAEMHPGITTWLCGHIHRKIERECRGIRILTSSVGYLRDPHADLETIAHDAVTLVEL